MSEESTGEEEEFNVISVVPDEPELGNTSPVATGSPGVWVRMCPSSENANPSIDKKMFQIGIDGKKLHIITRKREKLLGTLHETWLTFHGDGILQPTASQEEVYKSVVKDVVKKAMDGMEGSGMVLTLGPEQCGKSFTLFGHMRQFESRGVVPRALETIFEIVAQKQKEVAYSVRLGVVQVSSNKMRNLLSSEIEDHDQNFKGVKFQEIRCLEHALGLLMLALSSQKLNHQRCHTIVYIQIEGETLFPSKYKRFGSRVSFVKLASLPNRDPRAMNPSRGQKVRRRLGCEIEGTGARAFSIKALKATGGTTNSKDSFKEAIELRKDLFVVEQMFARSHQLHELHKLYSKLRRLGMKLLIKKPNSTPSEFFQQSKLAHCIQDIVSGNVELRIILNLRLEEGYLNPILEAIRFAERARCLNHKLKVGQLADPTEELKRELSLLLQELDIQEKLVSRAGAGPRPPFLTSALPAQPTKLTRTRKRIYDAAAFLDGKLDEIEIVSRGQVKAMFETLRAMWKYASDQQAAAAAQGQEHREEVAVIPEPVVEEEVIPPPVPPPSPTPPPKQSRSRSRKGSGSKRGKEKGKGKQSKQRGGVKKKQSQKMETVVQDSTGSAADHNLTIQNEPKSKGDEDDEEEEAEHFLEVNADEEEAEIEGEYLPMVQVRPEPPVPIPVAWDEFVLGEGAIEMLQEVKKAGASLPQFAAEFDHFQTHLKAVMTKLIQYAEDLDKIEEDKIAKSELSDFTGVLRSIPLEKETYRDTKSLEKSRDDVLAKLNSLRATIEAEKSMVDRAKNDCINSFHDFCMDRYGATYEKVEFPETIHIPGKEAEETVTLQLEHEEFAYDNAILAQTYKQIMNFAEKHARAGLGTLGSEEKQPNWKS